MNYSQKKTHFALQSTQGYRPFCCNMFHYKSTVALAVSSVSIGLLFYAPDHCKVNLLASYETCVETLLFSLFPLIVVANMLSHYHCASILGIPFRSFMQRIGFPEKAAGGIFSLALLGGFAPAITALRQKVKSNEFDLTQASYFLPSICFLGPSYIIVAVGGGMLHNMRTGSYLFISQVTANLLSAWVIRMLAYTQNTLTATLPVQSHINDCVAHSSNTAFATLIGDSFFSFLRLCSVLLYFQFLCTAIDLFIPKSFQCFFQMLLEVTTACNNIAQIGTRASFRCSIALSLLSASILLQARSLCPKEISFAPLLLSRLLQLPIALFLLRLLLYIPQPQASYNSFSDQVILIPRIPLDQAILLFIALVCLVERLHKPLQRR